MAHAIQIHDLIKISDKKKYYTSKFVKPNIDK